MNNHQSILFVFLCISGNPQLPSKELITEKNLSMFQSTLLNKCKNMRYQKQQTEKTYFQKNVHHSPLAVKCWKSERLYFSMLHRLQIFVQMVLFSCIFPFYPHAVGSFRGGRLQKNSPSKKSLNLSLKVAVFSRVRQQNQLW